MSPTPTPTPIPLPDHLEGSYGTSPSGLDDVLTDIAANADPNAPYGEKLDAALASVERTIFGVDYVPDTGVVITVSPVVLLVTAVVGVLIAVLIVARRARRSDEPRGQFIAERERERLVARERDAAAKVKAAEDVNR
ncbi:hypothetical protein MMAG44476_20099 [Mycolicibacterium mageritense DSM 44476 = CIP 104973]|uniref:DUF4349 domain-containing protein n=1 Tax=Mycolicibacterium mageritense TaxID=53462 RepID=A0ABN5YCW1_MYCME|nr:MULTISPECIES: hypothetical protein [Mycobacteriaceae]MDO3357786.1 hypothetical protein [Mycobacteroides abscessus subsp. massiliense]WKE45643.1 hypothetical protein P3M63_07515 [Mycobacteroides abscessus subsp. massiliense]CDO24089.1 hypothetical protein BN978_04581 [Mycolicibacterium mageritense DSM 44476 = CIP 104973]SLH66573.1 Uncharacterised protein [Mycobacteroides abscessus subsp. abscessus]BBX35969.1 hypothetical protein MMAGJ_52510 [Mycolicibacterium mageritense]